MNLKEMISELTLEEKASLCSGGDFWHTKAVERLGIPAIMVSDGPHGLRKQDLKADHLGINKSIVGVCFPTGSALACSFDRELARQVGQALGRECQAENVAVLLGPAVNMKRSPLCGRNFEYFSEDPYLAGELAASQIEGVQSQGVGTSVKHFAANNEEYRRMTSSSNIDERTLHEIYLLPFETAVKKSQPWTIMCSYNKINGTYASENHRLLTEILRNKWGFDGLVVSDWGAVNRRDAGLAAGLDLEMPSSDGMNDAVIVQAVKSGTLSEKDLNRAVERILRVVFHSTEKKHEEVFDRDADHELTRQTERECAVLLKNEQNILPLNPKQKIAFIGKFAKEPRYQGGGSSHINSYQVTGALESAKEIANVTYAQGYDIVDDGINQTLLREAVEIAKSADVAVVFAGLPATFESEGCDRTHMGMPACQNVLIEEVCKVQPNTVVVLHNGSPVEMPWVSLPKGILELYLGGEAVGAAAVDLLFGFANPCGRLAETFPLKLSDNPSYLFYHSKNGEADYREGIFVGYRYYDKKKMPILFPFGYGLSYTTFTYSYLTVSSKEIDDTDTLNVSVRVKNTGSVAGKEVVQLYVHEMESAVIRPEKELKGFEKVALVPGEEKEVSFRLDKHTFAYYNTDLQDWHVETGAFELCIGKSSREIVLRETIAVRSTTKTCPHFTMDTPMYEVLGNPYAAPIARELIALCDFGSDHNNGENSLGESTASMMEAMTRELPIHAVCSFATKKISRKDLEEAVDRMNDAQS